MRAARPPSRPVLWDCTSSASSLPSPPPPPTSRDASSSFSREPSAFSLLLPHHGVFGFFFLPPLTWSSGNCSFPQPPPRKRMRPREPCKENAGRWGQSWGERGSAEFPKSAGRGRSRVSPEKKTFPETAVKLQSFEHGTYHTPYSHNLFRIYHRSKYKM